MTSIRLEMLTETERDWHEEAKRGEHKLKPGVLGVGWDDRVVLSLLASLAEARAALKFYADNDPWTIDGQALLDDGLLDYGKTARAALTAKGTRR